MLIQLNQNSVLLDLSGNHENSFWFSFRVYFSFFKGLCMHLFSVTYIQHICPFSKIQHSSGPETAGFIYVILYKEQKGGGKSRQII